MYYLVQSCLLQLKLIEAKKLIALQVLAKLIQTGAVSFRKILTETEPNFQKWKHGRIVFVCISDISISIVVVADDNWNMFDLLK